VSYILLRSENQKKKEARDARIADSRKKASVARTVQAKKDKQRI
jgi:hypothetical protein